VGYSALSARDHQAALRLVGSFQSTARTAAEAHEGRVVKFLGDGVLVEFASSGMAVRAAQAMTREFADGPAPSSGSPPRLRIGVHVGEVAAAEDGDLYGDGVNVAARLQQAADPGAVWVSEDVWRQLRAHREFRFVSCGDHDLKGQSGPIRAYRLESDEPVRSPAQASGADRVIESLAVLPFVNMSADPEQEYFSDGIAEELLDAFAKIQPLRVAARTSSFQFKGLSLDVREVGRKLGVAAVLEGSVRKSGNRVRITAQLIGSEDGFHLWSDRYDRELEDIFAVQEEIAQSIVGALKVRLPGGSRTLVRKSRSDEEAYNLYLRGRHALQQGLEASLKLALELFEKAIERDPSFAGAYSGVADALLQLTNGDFIPREKSVPRAREAVERALTLDRGPNENS
jgi:TolB-like protein